VKPKLENKFREVWHPEYFEEKRDWHEKIIGIYHVSGIGCNHQDLDSTEHSGPCLRQTYFEYKHPRKNNQETEGNFEMGSDVHKIWQNLVKEWYPQADIERTVAKIFTRKGISILIVGSQDVHMPLIFNMKTANSKSKRKREIWDGKTASVYTLPKGKYDKNPTHFDQPKIYGGFEILFELNMNHNKITRVKIYYFDKHNKGTYIQREKFDGVEAIGKLADCVDRAFYLHNCLIEGVVPVPEPMKWCKYCKYITKCNQQGDINIIETKKGNIKRIEVR